MTDITNQQADARSVQETLAGDRAAFDSLVERHMGMVFAIAWGHLGDRDRAEDLVQEVFLRAYLALDRLSDPKLFAPWLGRIARNLAINWLRRDGRIARLTPLVDMEAVGDAVDPQARGGREQVESKERETVVGSAIAQLPAGEREAILLHFVEGLSATEIARRLGVHQSTISRRIQAALKQMRGILEPMIRESATALRPSRAVTSRTLGVIAAAAAMSATSKAVLAAKAAHDVGQVSTGTVGLALSLKAAFAAVITGITIGGKAMATGKGIAALIGAAAIVGGGIYIAQGESGPVSPSPQSVQSVGVVEQDSPLTITAVLPDGQRIALPTYGEDVRTGINADVEPSEAFLELNRIGLMGVLPRDFYLEIVAEGISPDDIFILETDVPVRTAVVSVDANIGAENVQGLPTVPGEIRESPDRSGVCEVRFGRALDHDLLVVMAGEQQCVAVLTDGSEDLQGLLTRLGSNIANPPQRQQVRTIAPQGSAPPSANGSTQRARSDMRSVATAIEAYRVDWNSYPIAIPTGDPRHLSAGDPLMSQMPSLPNAITTPVMYIVPTAMHDPYAATPEGIYAYDRPPENSSWFAVFGSWVVLSPGPDQDWDLEAISWRRRGRANVPLETIWTGIYDPTNGADSSGDIARWQRYP